MVPVRMHTSDGRHTAIMSESIDRLRGRLSGELLRSGEPGYDEARLVWNAMVDRRPAIIIRAAATADVVQAVRFAREHRLLLAVRGGGHHIAGHAVCDGGMMIDLSPMRSAGVDPWTRRVLIEGGATLADLDAATQVHGLATPVGINSTTGIAGLTLGGGFGWLSRKHGMTVDNLEAAVVVTASGEVVRASAREHPDLFWAVRGGGGNFGVVTRFEFLLHPVGPEVLAGLIVFPIAAAKSVLQQYRAFAANAPEELAVWALLRKAPPLPFLPASVHGQGIVALAICHAGDPKHGERHAALLRGFAEVVGEHVGVQPYAAWQRAFDPLLARGARNYWKSHNLTSLDDGLLDVVIDRIGRPPSPQSEIIIAALGGATMTPAPDATAYAHRDARFVMNVHGRWADAADDAGGIAWARDVFDAAAPFASGGVYVNFMTADEGARVHAAYGSNYGRLAQVKRRYDPDNLFRTNQNINPA
jgi:FAD/FMN-containing dehydrogenase